MPIDAVMPKKINKYIHRLIIEYRKEGYTDLLNILTKGELKIESHYFKYDKHYNHKICFLLPEECFENDISFANQDNICNKIAEDLNMVIIESNESVSEVKLDMKNESGTESTGFQKSRLKNEMINHSILNLWDKNCVRVFVSHSATNYDIAKTLKDCFIDFGVSCFAAHADIEPTTEWKEEIKKALISMEAMLLLITGDSCNSWWVNQEIGFALSRKIPVIPVKLDQNDPKGFVSEIQAMTLNQEHIRSKRLDILEKLVECIKNKLPQHPVWKTNLLNKFLKAKDSTFAYAKEAFMNIINFRFNNQEIDRIVETIKGPSTHPINQLSILLCDDEIDPKYLNKLSSSKYKYYVELLRDKILSQHTKKRYSIVKRSEQDERFRIVDNHQTINNQRPDTSNDKALPF